MLPKSHSKDGSTWSRKNDEIRAGSTPLESIEVDAPQAMWAWLDAEHEEATAIVCEADHGADVACEATHVERLLELDP